MKNINTSDTDIKKVLGRGVVADVLPSQRELKEALSSGRRLRFYLGLDATGPALHLAHAQNIMLLEDFRKLGHEIVVLVGDFTARIGDPSGKTKSRTPLSKEEVQKNIKSLVEQVRPLLDFDNKDNPAHLTHNSEWLEPLRFGDILELAAHFTVQQFIERDMFKKRIKDENPIHLNEFMYPLMQGYDSVALDVDVEIGGTDQTFNMLAGRTLLKRMKDKEKFVITTHLIENPLTGELMSKSKGTGVMLGTGPGDLFGQIMALPDEMTEVLLVRTTRLPLSEVEALAKKVKEGGAAARDAKMKLAEEVVSIHHSPDKAQKARGAFERVFQKGNDPKDAPLKTLPYKKEKLYQILTDAELTESNTEARRLIEDGAVEVGGTTITDPYTEISLDEEVLVRVGKHRFARIQSDK